MINALCFPDFFSCRSVKKGDSGCANSQNENKILYVHFFVSVFSFVLLFDDSGSAGQMHKKSFYFNDLN